MLPPSPQNRKYKLRWRFDFAQKPAKYGMWDKPGETKETQAWCQNGEGLIRAAVEGKDPVTKEEVILAQCDGHDFVNFQWMAAAKVNPFFKGTAKTSHFLLGLKLTTREKAFEVFPDGMVNKKDRTDKNINYATFGR
jgi:hypothetical protein